MMAVAARQLERRGVLATEAQVHSLTGSLQMADNLLRSRRLLNNSDGDHIIPHPIKPLGGDNAPTRQQLPLSLTARLNSLSASISSTNSTNLSVGEQVLDTIASTFNHQMHQNDQQPTATATATATTASNATTLATAIGAATGSTLQQQAGGPSLASFTGWEWLLITVLISIILISIIGNCLVCVAIFTDRRLRKLGNAFIVSLAIADLFVSCLVMTFALCNDLMNYWMFGEWFCDIWISFDIMCSTASILNLCAISLDRFIHIKDCLLYNQLMTKRVAISAVIIIWIISGLVSFVPINLGWHKPNHFKQPSANGTTSHTHHHLDLLASAAAGEALRKGAAHLDEEASYEEADGGSLALIGHDGSGDNQDRGRLKSAPADSGQRHGRQTRGIAASGESDGKISEIRGLAGSQIANKLHSAEESTSNPTASGEQLQWLANIGAATQAFDDRLGERPPANRRQSNHLSRGPTGRSNDDGGRRRGDHEDDDIDDDGDGDCDGDDDDVSKQSHPEPLGLHKNELSDQVAAPAGEFNLVAAPKQRGRRRSRIQPEPPEQIKHSRATRALREARWALHGDADDSNEWQLHAGRHELSRPPPGDPQEQTDQATASSNVDNQNARRQDKTLTKTTANRMGRQAQSGAVDEEPGARSRSAELNSAGGRQNWATTSQPGGTSLTTPAGATNPPATQLNELPQCMLTLTPTYAVISSTISFYIPCIIMLGLYSKLFACARKHVRNIKAISKAPQPIGFGTATTATPQVEPNRAGGGPTIPQTTSAPLSETATGFGQGNGSNRGEIINCRRPPASQRQDRAALASSLLISSSQTVTSVTNTTTTASSNAAGRPTVNNNERAAPNSLGSQCRAKLARLVRRPEPKAPGPESRSRTWIKFGRRPAAAATGGALKSGAARAPKSEHAESVLSTSSKLSGQTRDAAAQQQNSQKVGPNCAGLMMKLNNNSNNNSNNNQQNARTQTTATNRRADCNDASAGLPCDNNEDDETIAHGNETEPFLNERQAPEKRPRQPEADEADPSSRLAAAPPGESSQPDDDDETNPSRAETNATAGGTQILSATNTTFTRAGAEPLKSSLTSGNHQTSPRQRQSQLQHGGSWRKHQQSQQNKQQTNQLATHKAAITLGIIMGTFLFCWVPFFCLNIIKAFHGDSIPSSLFRAFTWLGYANSALNPIIYGIHNSEFRNAFNRIFFKHLTLKNGRQYLNRRFSYDLRPHADNQHENERRRWPNNNNNNNNNRNSNIGNQQNCAPNTLEVCQQQQQRLLTNSAPPNESPSPMSQQQQQPGFNAAHRHHNYQQQQQQQQHYNHHHHRH